MPEKDLKKILEKAPNAPGIYKMISAEGVVIYVGKAKDLKKRLRQYFQKNYEHSTRTKKLLEKMINIEFTAVDSELEAMILEHNLIKQLQPKYNVIMKDDKNYVYIKITKEDFPRIQIVRQIEKDNAKYIGPKTAAHKVKETLNVLKKIFPFRHCGLDIEYLKEHQVKITKKVIKYPCLDFYIKRCIGPCIGKCTPAEYQEIIKNVEKFLEGKADDIIKDLKDKMQNHAKNHEFEKAAKLRDKIQKVEDILEKQKVSDPNQEDKDVINYCITQDRCYFNLFQIRDGKLIGQENFILSSEELEENKENSEVLESFLKQYYLIATDIPKEILLPHEVEGKEEIEKLISKEKKSKLIIPSRGTKNRLLEMSLNNARIYADRNKPNWQKESDLTAKSAEELREILNIPEKLKRIECYDISHLSGTDTVGSMIVFENGVPKNSLYRKFKLKTIENKPDDYKSLEEVLTRRFSKIALEFMHKDYKFRKATKKDKEFTKTDDTSYVVEKDKKQKGFISTKEYSNKVAELNNLFVTKEERGKKLGYNLIKNAIKKIKAKRIYIICKAELKDYYLLAGFEEIKQIPQELEEKYQKETEKQSSICLAYDKMKHQIDESFSQIPNLVIIDGGKGQLTAATKIFEKFNLNIPYIALAKQLEEIFTPNQKVPIILSRSNEALKLLQRARDEAHRFAITYNRVLRTKRI